MFYASKAALVPKRITLWSEKKQNFIHTSLHSTAECVAHWPWAPVSLQFPLLTAGMYWVLWLSQAQSVYRPQANLSSGCSTTSSVSALERNWKSLVHLLIPMETFHSALSVFSLVSIILFYLRVIMINNILFIIFPAKTSNWLSVEILQMWSLNECQL